MPIVIKTRDRRDNPRFLLCSNQDAAKILVNALLLFEHPVKTEWVVVHRDPVTMHEFVVVDGRQLFLHPRSWGAELKPEPPEEVTDDVV
jgi:hypothetical protein